MRKPRNGRLMTNPAPAAFQRSGPTPLVRARVSLIGLANPLDDNVVAPLLRPGDSLALGRACVPRSRAPGGAR